MISSFTLCKLALVLLLVFGSMAQADDPTVSNLRVVQKTEVKQVEIYYDLLGGNTPVFVSLKVSFDAGATFATPAATFSGDVGGRVAPGRNRKITWDPGADWSSQITKKAKFHVAVSNKPPKASEFVMIPAGSFQMGDQMTDQYKTTVVNDTSSIELPVHSVYISAFYMAKYEVTKELWDEVRAWGLNNGYADLPVGNGSYASKGMNYPVHSITWYDMLKWCNARSQKEKLKPCYMMSGSIYKTGNSRPDCNWTASGYRLPTEAEWEKAARGGLTAKNFPWGDTIDHDNANYEANGRYSYDTSKYTSLTDHPTYAVGGRPFTSPVGSFKPNGYGLYDMAGNVWERCWDWYGTYPSTAQSDSRGPASGSKVVLRGGSWLQLAHHNRVAYRGSCMPDFVRFDGGFRLAHSAVSGKKDEKGEDREVDVIISPE